MIREKRRLRYLSEETWAAYKVTDRKMKAIIIATFILFAGILQARNLDVLQLNFTQQVAAFLVLLRLGFAKLHIDGKGGLHVKRGDDVFHSYKTTPPAKI